MKWYAFPCLALLPDLQHSGGYYKGTLVAPPPMPTMYSSVSGSGYQALHILSTGKMEGPLLTQGVGLIEGHKASVNTIADILLLGCLCRK